MPRYLATSTSRSDIQNSDTSARFWYVAKKVRISKDADRWQPQRPREGWRCSGGRAGCRRTSAGSRPRCRPRSDASTCCDGFGTRSSPEIQKNRKCFFRNENDKLILAKWEGDGVATSHLKVVFYKNKLVRGAKDT